MENLVNDLLDVKRLEAGTVALQLRAVRCPGRVVEQVLDVFRPSRRAPASRWTPAVTTWRRRRRRRTAPGAGAVQPRGQCAEVHGAGRPGHGLRPRRIDDIVLFTVADTGVGIAAEHLPHVFDRFWQARREGRKGLGLGLAIARGLVEAHGGRIWVESVSDEGSTFLFTVPVRPVMTRRPGGAGPLSIRQCSASSGVGWDDLDEAGPVPGQRYGLTVLRVQHEHAAGAGPAAHGLALVDAEVAEQAAKRAVQERVDPAALAGRQRRQGAVRGHGAEHGSSRASASEAAVPPRAPGGRNSRPASWCRA
jgi:hypothetical protein